MSSSPANTPGLGSARRPRRSGSRRRASWPASRRPASSPSCGDNPTDRATTSPCSRGTRTPSSRPGPPSDPRPARGRDTLRHRAARRPPLRRRRAGGTGPGHLRHRQRRAARRGTPRRARSPPAPAADGAPRPRAELRGREASRAALGGGRRPSPDGAVRARAPRPVPGGGGGLRLRAPARGRWRAARVGGRHRAPHRRAGPHRAPGGPGATGLNHHRRPRPGGTPRAPAARRAGRVDPPRRRRRRRAHARRQRPRGEPEHRRPGRERARRRGARQPPDAPLDRVRCGLDLRRRREQPARVACPGCARAFRRLAAALPRRAAGPRRPPGLRRRRRAPRRRGGHPAARVPPGSAAGGAPAAPPDARAARDRRPRRDHGAPRARRPRRRVGAQPARAQPRRERDPPDRPRGARGAARYGRPRAPAPIARDRADDRRGIAPAPASTARAHGDPADGRLADHPHAGREGRRTDGPGLDGERADPAPRELAVPGARRVRLAGHARARPGAVPDSRGLGATAYAGAAGGAGPAAEAGAGASPCRPAWPAPHRDPGRASASPDTSAACARGALMATISTRERILIGVAGGAVLLTVGWVLVVEPLRARNRELADLVPSRVLVLAKRRELIARAPEVRRELDETARRVAELKARLLTAAAPPVAASELVKIVKDAAGQAGLEARSERILTPAARGGLLEIPS